MGVNISRSMMARLRRNLYNDLVYLAGLGDVALDTDMVLKMKNFYYNTSASSLGTLLGGYKKKGDLSNVSAVIEMRFTNYGAGKIEEELASLDDEDKKMMQEELGISISGLDKLVVACYNLLGLMSFLTAGPQEIRAWTIEIGTKAPQAAGKIHTDFEKGFIKAEVINYQVLLDCGSYSKAKELGKVRLEGKDYVVQDGDVMLFRFNV